MGDDRTYWNKHVGPDGKWRKGLGPNGRPRTGPPPGEDLAALRAGLGQPAGAVPQMWQHYTRPGDERLSRKGRHTDEQIAEHAALALFGLHQQSQDAPMHRPEVGLGKALRALRQHERSSENAVDVRVAAMVTSTSVTALLGRLRGLITQLRAISQPLDYDRLMNDIRLWHKPAYRADVRRRWGIDYHPAPRPPGGGPAASDQVGVEPSTP